MSSKLHVLAVALVAIAAALLASERPAAAQSATWERIAKTGVVRIGVIPNRPPYFEQVNGEWQGFTAEMSRDVVKALGVAMEREIKPEWVLSSWTTVVLDLQAGKFDFFLGMAMSEERKKALDMFGPIWSVPNVAINAANFNPGEAWEDYNKSDVKVTVAMGTTDEQAARKFAPKATIRAMKATPEAVLDIQSGNAQTWITTVLTGLGAMKENSSLANLVLLKPLYALPSGGGTRKDGDGRFYTFMQGWGWSYRESGLSQKRIFDSMKQFGLDVDRMPKDVKF
jgi:polar amino acid transport system substrate-binding protein